MHIPITLSICVIAACILTTCHSFFITNPIQASMKSVKCRMLESTNMDRNNDHEGVSMIKKRILHSLVSLGVAVTAFSVSSNAVDLPMSYTSEDKSIVFKHTEDLQFSPKPLKTHDKEILLKSESIKGFNAGVTVSLHSISRRDSLASYLCSSNQLRFHSHLTICLQDMQKRERHHTCAIFPRISSITSFTCSDECLLFFVNNIRFSQRF